MVEFRCKRCGKCCGIVPFNKKEYNEIRDIAKKNAHWFYKSRIDGKNSLFSKTLL